MSSQTYDHHTGHAARYAPARGQTAAAVSQHLHGRSDQRGYTLTHAGRQIRIGPVAFWIVVGTLVIMAVWSVITGSYFAFSEDVLTRLIGRQAQMQFAYEDRIAELRAQVDRVTSHQLLDQEQFEKKLEALLRRQAALEQRSATLGNDIAPGSANRRSVPAPAHNTPPRPSPISDTVILTAPPDREARLESRGLPDSGTRFAGKAGSGGLDGMLGRVAQSLDRVEHRQTSTLTAMEENIDTKSRRIRSVLADLGVDLGKSLNKSHGDITGSIGGPYVPLKPGSHSVSFERQLQRIGAARSQLDRLSRALTVVPVRKPIFGEVDMSSPFGARMDPFLKGPAIHTGIDIRGDTGDPVRATASGTVVTASWQGGYGKMVQIDHGNGLATRYGHLSEIEVKVGQHIGIGQTIGRIGSTGRSTGPHLHYETRVHDDPVDPQKFLRAGVRLGGA